MRRSHCGSRVARRGFWVGFLLLSCAAFAQTDSKDGYFTLKNVIIDAGHGGKDPGAVNQWGGKEKDVTLQVALRLRDYLKKNASYKLVMTRDSDTYPTLPERAKIANQFGPEESVFVSVHCNASTSPAARGAETYVYNNEASNGKAQRVAARENKGSDFNLSFILADLRHRAMAPFTESLARGIQENLVKSVRVDDRQVQRGPFYVLFYTTMPSVLVEIGFITNQEEHKLLATPAHQQKVAEAIGRAILAFDKDTDSWRLAAMKNE